jgi:hypothetical protein
MVALGGVGGATGGWENRGPEATAGGEEVALAAGLPGGPTWAHAARTTHSPAARESRTAE